MISARTYGLLGCVLLWGCARVDRDPGANLVRDSAGLRIVENTQPTWKPDAGWRIENEPGLQFGPEYPLYQVSGAYRLPDGRIVLAHASVPEILTFSPDGRLLQRNGKRGEGPGEFGQFNRVRRGSNDSILVLDYLTRVSVLTPDGRYVRSFRVPNLPNGSAAILEDVFGDGSLLVTPVGGVPSGQRLERRRRQLWRLDPRTGAATELATFAELETYHFQKTIPRPIAFRRPFFGKTAYYIAGQDRLYWAMTDSFQINVDGLDGKLVTRIRRRHETRRFGAGEVTELIETAVTGHDVPAARPALRRVLEELPRSGTVPAFGWPDYGPSYGPILMLDDDQNLWVAEYYMPGEARNARTVFAADGTWLGTVELPDRFSPTHIGSDFILGVWRDELDVEHIRLYELVKPGDPLDP
ncbi:MAG: hypothetical protein ACREM1_22320 [Longimicrobiales bacterium]